jgi:hypothetical protein
MSSHSAMTMPKNWVENSKSSQSKKTSPTHEKL